MLPSRPQLVRIDDFFRNSKRIDPRNLGRHPTRANCLRHECGVLTFDFARFIKKQKSRKLITPLAARNGDKFCAYGNENKLTNSSKSWGSEDSQRDDPDNEWSQPFPLRNATGRNESAALKQTLYFRGFLYPTFGALSFPAFQCLCIYHSHDEHAEKQQLDTVQNAAFRTISILGKEGQDYGVGCLYRTLGKAVQCI